MRILVTYATAGIGHKKAAVAVSKALEEMKLPDVQYELIDALDYTSPFFKWTYLKLYLLAVNRLSLLWGFMYYLTDNFYVNIIVSRLRRINNWLNSKKLIEHLLETKPNVVISTHFFASEIIANLKKKGVLKTRLVTIVTDYRLHSWWVSDFVDTYVVSNDDARDDLVRWGIALSKIKVIGIPVEPVFAKKLDRAILAEKFGLKRDLFTILVIGGGFGVGPIEEIVKNIGNISKPVQIIVVCGHNEELRKRAEALRPLLAAQVKVLGFVDNVYELMEVADVLISKSGGVTVSESLAKELPMIVISPIPGQETGNSSFLIKYGAAIQVDNMAEISGVVEGLIADPEKMKRMREAIRGIRKPMACYDVVKAALEER